MITYALLYKLAYIAQALLLKSILGIQARSYYQCRVQQTIQMSQPFKITKKKKSHFSTKKNK